MISFITTFRGTDRCRLRNLYAVEKQLYSFFPDWELVVVEQDAESIIDYQKFCGKPAHFLAHNPGSFNKSWGLNVGYRLSQGEILVITDADILIAPEDLGRAVKAVKHSMDIVRPFSQLIDMTKKQTQIYLDQGALPDAPSNTQGYDRSYLFENICLAGGLFVIRRKFYEQVGGFEEGFCGWGGEDDAFSIRAEALTSKSVVARSAKAWHLWHPRNDNYGHPDYKNNVMLLNAFRNYTIQQHSDLAKEELGKNGREDKFGKSN